MRQTTYITLNLQTPNYATVYAARDNLLSRYVSATLLDGAAPWTPPAGTYVEISYIKSDGTGGYYDTDEDGNLAYTITNNVVEFVLAQQALTVPGDVRMALDFFNADGDSLSTFTFVLTVPENSFPYEQLASGNYFNVMQATLAEMAEYVAKLRNGYGAPLVASTVAGMTDQDRVYVYTGSETGYTSGNWYYWDGSAWTSGGIYNSTAFETDKTLTVSGSAADAESAGQMIRSLDKNVSGVPMFFESGYYAIGSVGSTVNIGGARTSATNVVSAVVPCNPGDTVYFHIVGGGTSSGGARAYAFLDADNKVIARAGTNVDLTGWEITAPDSTAHIVVNALSIKDGVALDYYAFIGIPTNERLDTIQSFQIFSHRQKVLLSRIFDSVAYADINMGQESLAEFRNVLGYSEINTDNAWLPGTVIRTSDGTINSSISYCSATIATVDGEPWFYAVPQGTTIWFDGDITSGDVVFSIVLHEYNSAKQWKRSNYLVNVVNGERVRVPVKVKPDTAYIRFCFNLLSSAGGRMTQDIIDAHFAASREVEVQ